MKTLEGGLSALRKRMGECYSKWVRLSERGATLPAGIDSDDLDNPRVMVDNRYSKIADVDWGRMVSERQSPLRLVVLTAALSMRW